MSESDRERTATSKYLRNFAVRPARPVVIGARDGVSMAVVIPALAEKSSLFQCLAKLATNPPGALARTLVITVINNHPRSQAGHIRNNQETLRILESLVKGPGEPPPPVTRASGMDFRTIMASGLRLACIDASSPGREIPDQYGGVGTARKIGMDVALEVLSSAGPSGIICCLDADTWVQDHYLDAVADYFRNNGGPGAVVDYAHRIPPNPRQAEAVGVYEIFLRYYVLGLAFAGSPYAFHSIGSTMVCTAEGYRTVRGMNRRPAAEDFHFLNKLAKIGRIGLISGTTVSPSGRPSARVPFGTGCRVRRYLQDRADADKERLYDPAIFQILKQWLGLLESEPTAETVQILTRARHLHPELACFLQAEGFDRVWPEVRKHAATPKQLLRQFRDWFDGLKTLKLVHHLSRTSHPPLPMPLALQELMTLCGQPLTADNLPNGHWTLETLIRVLEQLRGFPLDTAASFHLDLPHSFAYSAKP